MHPCFSSFCINVFHHTIQSPFGVNGGNYFIDVLITVRLHCCSVTDDHCIFDHRLKNPFVLHVALIYITASTKSAVLLCAFGKVSFAEGWSSEKIFVMQDCIAAFSLQFAVPLQTHFPSYSGNRKRLPNLL